MSDDLLWKYLLGINQFWVQCIQVDSLNHHRKKSMQNSILVKNCDSQIKDSQTIE